MNGNGTVVNRENMNIVIVGHVDHGKSTVIGRLMADTGSLPEGKLEQVRERCRRNAKPFEYAYLLDALKDEQEQGITIDSARCFFKSKQRDYIIIDAPGHIEFLKNMVSGAARAESALLVIDAKEGIQENTKRHGYLLSMLGIRQICVLINKMDLVDYDESVFRAIAADYAEFLRGLGIVPTAFIPISGFHGDNIISTSTNMPWHEGPNVLEALEAFRAPATLRNKPFRMPVQGVYKFTADGDDRRIVAGTVESGAIKCGDSVIFYPSGKCSRLKSVEAFGSKPLDAAECGWAVGFTLTEQIYVRRGELAVLDGETKPHIARRFRANVLWLGRDPLVSNKDYLLKLGTGKVSVRLESIIRVLNTSSLEQNDSDAVHRHEVAECILVAEQPVAFDLAEENISTGRFVLVDHYNIAGGGIILEALSDHQSKQREQVAIRNYKWVQSEITEEQRAEKYGQKSALVLITGPKDTGKKTFAKLLEKRFFDDGKIVYFMGIANVLYGVDADIKAGGKSHQEEHIRRLAEVANIMLDAGVILVVTAVELTHEDLSIITTSIEPDKISIVWSGETLTTDLPVHLHMPPVQQGAAGVMRIKSHLQERGVIFRP